MLTIYSKTQCPFCVRAKNYLEHHDVPYQEINIEQDQSALQFIRDRGHRTVPQIYTGDKLFVEGGWEGLSKLTKDEIQQRMKSNESTFDLGTL